MAPPFLARILAALRRGGRYLWVILMTAALLMGAALPAQADPLDNWHWRNPTPQGNYLYGAAHGNNKYVAVGDYGTILTSPDGSSWTIAYTNPGYTLSGVTYGLDGSNNPHFVAVGSDTTTGNTPVIMTSTDGTSWSPATVPSGPTGLDGVTCGNGTFVAVSWNGYICYSTDGSNWTSKSISSVCVLKGVAFGKGTFVAVGVDNSQASVVWTVADPSATWTSQSGGGSARTTLEGVCYADDTGTFVAVGYNNGGSSSDKGVILASANQGVAWDVYNQPTTGAYTAPYDLLTGVAYGHGTFVAVGYDGESNGGGLTLTAASPDMWGTAPSSHTAPDLYLCGVAFGAGKFVAVGDYGEIVVSEDGHDWSTPVVKGPAPDLALTPHLDLAGAASNGEGTYVAVGYDSSGRRGGILTSTNGGTTWATSGGDFIDTLCGITYGNHTFVAVGYYGDGGSTVMTSPDGQTWIISHPGDAYQLYGVTYGNGTFVAVGEDGLENAAIFTCPDPTKDDWTVNPNNIPGPYPGELNAVAYGDHTFVAVGNNDTVWACGDDPTVAWTVYAGGEVPYENLTGVAYGAPNGVPTFVAVESYNNGDQGSGVIDTSTDGGADWSGYDTDSQLWAVACDGNTFVAVGDNGTILTSTDPANNWTSRQSGTDEYNLKGVTYGGGPFLAVGDSGTILQSDNVNPPPPSQLQAPDISPDDTTTYTAPLQVTVTNPYPNDKPVYYTTDGSPPSTGSPSFSGPSTSFPLNQSATVEAGVYDEGTLTWSATTIRNYTITSPAPGQPYPPAIDPDGGTFTIPNTVTVTITNNPSNPTVGESVYYTTAKDASNLDHTEAYYYPGPFTLSQTTTVTAKVYDDTAGWSDPTSATFTFNQPSSPGGGGAPVVSALTVTPSSYTVNVGGTGQFTATYYPNGQSAGGGTDVTGKCTWSSADQTIATVNTTGLATGVKQGNTVIKAGYNGQTNKATLTVVAAAPPGGGTLPEGALLDRHAKAVFAGSGQVTNGVPDGMVNLPNAGSTITIPVDTQSPGPDYTLEVYHWQAGSLPGTNFPGRWVALATTSSDGKAVAVNDGNYTGWFAAWWVVRPNFTDTGGSWALSDINRMNALGLIEGSPGPGGGLDRPFEPDRSITRAEFTTIVARILGLTPGGAGAPYNVLKPLSDTQADAILKADFADAASIPGWARPYVAAMTRAGYVEGVQGNFDANHPITRIQAGVIVSRFLTAVGYSGPADLSRFQDAAQIPDWAKGHLDGGVLNGSGGLLRPNDPITRAEACTVLLRLFRDLGF